MTDLDPHWLDRDVFDADGNSLGAVADVYVDDATQQPEWLALRTGLFGSKLSFVPVAAAAWRDDGVHLPFTKDAIKRSPHPDVVDDRLLPEHKEELLRYYSGHSGVPSHHVTHDREIGEPTVVDLVRSEEEVSVGTTTRPGSRVRLVKYVVTENVTTTVEVRREQVRLEHEPIVAGDAPAGDVGGGVGGGLQPPTGGVVEWRDAQALDEIVLYEEEVVVEKRVVPRERVRLVVDTITEMQQVDEIVRRERISVEGDVEGAPGTTSATTGDPLLGGGSPR